MTTREELLGSLLLPDEKTAGVRSGARPGAVQGLLSPLSDELRVMGIHILQG